MSGAITIVVEDVSTLRVTLGGAADTAIDPTAWMVGVASGLGASPSVTEVEVDGDDYLLTVYPSLTPAATYQVTGPIKTAYYSSPGGAGDYAEADSVVAARVVFPGASAPVCTVLAWAKNLTSGSANGLLCVSDDGSPQLLIYTSDDPFFVATVRNAVGDYSGIETGTSYSGGWQLMALVMDGSTGTAYLDDVVVDSFALAAAPYSTVDIFKMAFNGSSSAFIDWRGTTIIDRALSANEIADLYAAGPTHHPLRATGTHWAAGQSIPIIWYEPAVAGVVANSGDGGACDLTFNGDIESITDGTSTVSDTIAIPSDLVEAFVPIPLTGRLPVRQLLAIIGRQHQRIAGTGATIMREPWTPGDTRLLVKSTLKLPSAGAVFAGNLRFTYVSKTTGSLEGVTPQHETVEPISIGAFVVFDESSRVPQDLPL